MNPFQFFIIVIVILVVGATIYGIVMSDRFRSLFQIGTYGFNDETYNKIGSGTNKILYFLLLSIIYIILITFILMSSVFKNKIFHTVDGQAGTLQWFETVFLVLVILTTLFIGILFFVTQDYGTRLSVKTSNKNLLLSYNDSDKPRDKSGRSIRVKDDKVMNGLFVIYKDKSYDYNQEYEYDNELSLNNRILSVTIVGNNLKNGGISSILLPSMTDLEQYFDTYKNYLVGHIHISKNSNELNYEYVITVNNHIISRGSFQMNDNDSPTTLYVYINKLDYTVSNYYKIAIPESNKKRYNWSYNSKDSNKVSYKIK